MLTLFPSQFKKPHLQCEFYAYPGISYPKANIFEFQNQSRYGLKCIIFYVNKSSFSSLFFLAPQPFQPFSAVSCLKLRNVFLYAILKHHQLFNFKFSNFKFYSPINPQLSNPPPCIFHVGKGFEHLKRQKIKLSFIRLVRYDSLPSNKT